MPRINKLTTDTTLTGDDKLLGSDSSGATRNYTLEQITNFVIEEGTDSYKHHQNSASAEWVITHNLNLTDYLPSVTIKLSGGGTYANVQAQGVVTYVNNNSLKINLAKSESGYAYIKK